MLIIFAIIAGLFAAPGWLAFWVFLAWTQGHRFSVYLILPFLLGIFGMPTLALGAIAVIWYLDGAKKLPTVYLGNWPAYQVAEKSRPA